MNRRQFLPILTLPLMPFSLLKNENEWKKIICSKNDKRIFRNNFIYNYKNGQYFWQPLSRFTNEKRIHREKLLHEKFTYKYYLNKRLTHLEIYTYDKKHYCLITDVAGETVL